MNIFDKTTKWISNGINFDMNQKEVGSPAIYLRKEFTIQNKINTAIVNICGLGLYELLINGVNVTDAVLKPSFTNYDKTLIYNTFDITKFLKKGSNFIDVILGDGWMNQACIDEWSFYKAPWRSAPKLFFNLNIDDDDDVIVSDESWLWAYGEITSNCLRVGETHDINAEREYEPVKIVDAPKGEFKQFEMPFIKACEKIKPVSIKKTDKNYVYDFGKNMSGYIIAKIKAPKGTLVKIVYSDRLVNDECDNKSNGMYIYNEKFDYQTDKVITSGKSDAFIPRFVYHGFRYVTITNNCEIEFIEAHFVHTDLKRGGSYKSDNELFNKYYDMTIQALLSNYVDFPTDCPHREKNGWTGDAQLSLESYVYNFDMHGAYKKWLNDIADSQLDSGKISCIVPTGIWGYDWGWGPAWDFAFFAVSNAMIDYYQDIETPKQMYPYLKKYFDFILTNFKDGLCTAGLGDWNYPKNHQFDVCPTDLITTCYVYSMAGILAKFASLFAKDDLKFYLEKKQELKNNILAKYSDDKALSGLAALTYFGLADKSDEVIKYLIDHDYTPDMGIVGTKCVFDTLGRRHRPDIVYKILSRKEYPTYRIWMDNGQTTLCEDFELTNSLNHHMFSPISHYFVRFIAGVEILADGNITINPCFDEHTNEVNCSVNTFKGVYKIEIKKDEDKYTIKANCPDGGLAIINGQR